MGNAKRISILHLIKVQNSFYFFRLGLNVSVCAQATWQRVQCWIKVRESARVDLVEFRPPDHDQMHVRNSEPSIASVKSDGCDLILQSENRGVTRDCLWTVQ